MWIVTKPLFWTLSKHIGNLVKLHRYMYRVYTSSEGLPKVGRSLDPSS